MVFGPVQTDFVVNSLSTYVEEALLDRIRESVKCGSSDALPQLIGAMFLRVHAESSVKI